MCVFTSITAGTVMTALAIASAAAAAGSTALGVISSENQAKAQAAQYEYQAKTAERNKQIAENNAAMERQTGLEEARRQRIKTLQAIGSQQAGLAANGIDVSYGTSLDLIEDTAMFGELDALTIQYNSERNARNYDTQAQNFASDAVLERYAGANAQRAGHMNSLSLGISGLGRMASSGSKMIGNSGGMGSLGG